VKTFPDMACERCGRCCGLVPCTDGEYKRIARYTKDHIIKPRDSGISCPFLREQGCAVYPVRPMICRAFGHSSLLPCIKGHNVDIDEAAVSALIRRNGKPTRYLHSFLGNPSVLNWLRERQAERIIAPCAPDPPTP